MAKGLYRMDDLLSGESSIDQGTNASKVNLLGV